MEEKINYAFYTQWIFVISYLNESASIFVILSPFCRTWPVLWHSHEQRILLAESSKSRILGMVDTLLQWLREQRDTRFVPIRSAKLSVNVLLAHWHHVRTTDTVIVVSSYKISCFTSSLTLCPLSREEAQEYRYISIKRIFKGSARIFRVYLFTLT